MNKKTVVQIFLIIFLIFITFLFFNFYYVDNSKQIQKNSSLDKSNLDETNNNSDNLIKDIKYSSNNNKGDIYEILADYGEPSLIDPNLMFLTNVSATIIFIDKANVKLKSKFANFNTKTFETTFINDVKIVRLDEIITGDELYLVLDSDPDLLKKNPNIEQNLIRMSRNILYEKPGYTLKADVIEIDLITKNSKIYMNDKLKKVLAQSKIK